MIFLQVVVEALLYYLACTLLAKKEQAPGLLRVFLVVLLLAFVSNGIKGILPDFWISSAIVTVVNFFILWLGLGIGLFRTILALIAVMLLRSLLVYVFQDVGHGPALFTMLLR